MNGPTITAMMQAYADDAVNLAQERFGIHLDYSEASIAHVEEILDHFHKSIPQGFVKKLLKRSPTPAEVEQVAKMFGGYTGEVMRRHLGGEWTLDSGIDSEPTITLAFSNEAKVFPPSKVYKRLMNGEGDGVPFYYHVVKMKAQEEQRST